MLGGGQTYQIPEVLLGKTYDKTVDLYLYGLLAYEMLCGQPAFPMRNSEEEQEERIKSCTFTFPDEDTSQLQDKDKPQQLMSPRGCPIDLTYSEVSDATGWPKRTISTTKSNPLIPEISAEAKSLIRGLIVANGKKRLSINKIKQHEFFQPIKFQDVEKTRIKMASVEMKNPRSGMFDEIEPDSADEDFEHEFEELCHKGGSVDSSSRSSNQFAHLKESLQGPLPKGN